MYRPIEQATKINFRVRAKDLISPDGKSSTDFYFGFVREELNDLYPDTSALSIKDFIDGEYIIVRGLEKDTTYGPFYRGENPYYPHTIIDNDGRIKQDNVIEVEINVSNTSWNVIIKNLSEKDEPVFVGENLDLLGKYFTFGFRVPENGFMDIDVYDLQIQ